MLAVLQVDDWAGTGVADAAPFRALRGDIEDGKETPREYWSGTEDRAPAHLKALTLKEKFRGHRIAIPNAKALEALLLVNRGPGARARDAAVRFRGDPESCGVGVRSEAQAGGARCVRLERRVDAGSEIVAR